MSHQHLPFIALLVGLIPALGCIATHSPISEDELDAAFRYAELSDVAVEESIILRSGSLGVAFGSSEQFGWHPVSMNDRQLLLASAETICSLAVQEDLHSPSFSFVGKFLQVRCAEDQWATLVYGKDCRTEAWSQPVEVLNRVLDGSRQYFRIDEGLASGCSQGQ